MIHTIVSVKDRAVDAFGRPFFTPAIGAAIRSFTDEVNRNGSDNPMYQHADDYDLYHLGTFDDSTGEFQPVYPPTVLLRGKDALTTE